MTELSSGEQARKARTTAKTLVLGVGNPILSDDGVGIHVLRQLEKKYWGIAGLEFDELFTGGLSLAERFVGYEKVIMIDALALEAGQPGEVHRLSIDDFKKTVRSYCVHDCNLATAYELLKKELGAEQLPQDVTIIAIEALELNEFGETLSEPVKQAIPKAIALVEQELAELLQKKCSDA